MACGTTEVYQTTLRQQNDAFAVREDDMVNLRLNVLPLILFEGGAINFVVKVTNIAHDRLIFHGGHVIMVNDLVIARCRYEDVGLTGRFIHCHDSIAFHRGLQRTDRIDFCDPDRRTQSPQ